MGKQCGLGKGLFGLLEGGGHGRGPVERLRRANEGISEGSEGGGGIGKETAVEVYEAEEALEIFDRCGLRIVGDGLDMSGEGSNARSCHMMTEEINGGLCKRAFGQVYQEAIGSQDGEELMEVMEVLLEGGAGHQNVV